MGRALLAEGDAASGPEDHKRGMGHGRCCGGRGRSLFSADSQAVAAQQRHIQALEKELQSLRRNVRDWYKPAPSKKSVTEFEAPA